MYAGRVELYIQHVRQQCIITITTIMTITMIGIIKNHDLSQSCHIGEINF